MAGSAIASAVLPAVASAGTSFALSKAFGGGGSASQQVGANRTTGTIFGNNLSLLESPGRGLQIRRENATDRTLGAIENKGRLTANRIGNLRRTVPVGMSKFRQTRLLANERARERSVGNLRDNLARRRVLGSSFGNDALTRADLAFAEEAQKIEAESFLQELDLNLSLIKDENDVFNATMAALLEQGNFETGAAITFATGASAAQSRISDALGNIAVANAQGRGKLFGGIADAVGSGVSKILGGV